MQNKSGLETPADRGPVKWSLAGHRNVHVGFKSRKWHRNQHLKNHTQNQHKHVINAFERKSDIESTPHVKQRSEVNITKQDAREQKSESESESDETELL